MLQPLAVLEAWHFAAAAGGILGAMWATEKRLRQSTTAYIMEILLGMVAASGVVDKYVGHTTIAFSAFIGALVGVASGFMLDAVAELMPSISRKVLKNMADRFGGTKE